MVIATARLVYRRPLLRPTSSPTTPSPQNAISTLFLQLPPTYRSFHASPKPQFYNAALSATHTVLETIHSTTGLPWVYTLPLAALLIRTTLVLPISIYHRRSMRKQAALSPLISAWHHVLRRETMAEVGHLGPTVAQSTTLSKIRKKRAEIYKRFDCQLWHNYVTPIIQLPVWLITIETIRKMCGAQVGLLGMVVNRTSGIEGDGTAQMATEQMTTVLKESTFAAEGALWFPDLLLPDPQLILPFMLSGAMLLNLSNAVGPNAAAWQKRLTNSLRIVALAIGPLTLHVPSAMLVYWISSSTLAYTQARLLDIFMPVKLPVQPCKPKQPRGLDIQKMEGV